MLLRYSVVIGSVVFLVLVSGLSLFVEAKIDPKVEDVPHTEGFVWPIGSSDDFTKSYTDANSHTVPGYHISQVFNQDYEEGWWLKDKAGSKIKWMYGHTGLDLSNGRAGDNVRAITRSIVVRVHSADSGHGYMIRAAYRDWGGNVRYYQLGHMQAGSLLVKEKDILNKGQTIGKVGSTGFSTSPHIHFEDKDLNTDGPGYLYDDSDSQMVRYQDPRLLYEYVPPSNDFVFYLQRADIGFYTNQAKANLYLSNGKLMLIQKGDKGQETDDPQIWYKYPGGHSGLFWENIEKILVVGIWNTPDAEAHIFLLTENQSWKAHVEDGYLIDHSGTKLQFISFPARASGAWGEIAGFRIDPSLRGNPNDGEYDFMLHRLLLVPKDGTILRYDVDGGAIHIATMPYNDIGADYGDKPTSPLSPPQNLRISE